MTDRRMVLIVNPRGGRRRGLDVLEQVRPKLAAAGIDVDVRVTEHPGHAAGIARSADLTGCDGLCVIGGDGTLHEAVNGLLQRPEGVRPPVGIIPGGTGNCVLQQLGSTTPEQAIGPIISGRGQRIDVARLDGPDGTQYCLSIVGWGSVVDINRTAERLRWLGPPRYALSAFREIARARRRRLTLTLDGETETGDFLFVIACNTRFTGKGMDLAPRASLTDGLLDVVIVRQATRRQMLALFQRVYDGTHLALPCVDYRQVRSLGLETTTRDPLNIDGELQGQTPVRIELLPKMLEVFA
jgi:YegS/Rv2252/BmrU family lipid kinase